jgi:hypothetical protein
VFEVQGSSVLQFAPVNPAGQVQTAASPFTLQEPPLHGSGKHGPKAISSQFVPVNPSLQTQVYEFEST